MFLFYDIILKNNKNVQSYMILMSIFVFSVDCLIQLVFPFFLKGHILVSAKGHPAFLTLVVSGPGNLSSVCLPDISPTHRALSHVSSFSVNCMHILSSQNVKFDFVLKAACKLLFHQYLLYTNFR